MKTPFVACFSEQGRIDSSFGTHGIVTLALDEASGARGIAVDGRNRIVIAGDSVFRDDLTKILLARLKRSGDLDESFGESGIVLSKLGDSALTTQTANELKIDAEGRLVVVGEVRDDIGFGGSDPISQGSFMTAVYSADGELLDWKSERFGAPTPSDPIVYSSSHASAVAVDEQGNIYATGMASISGFNAIQVPVVKYARDGDAIYPHESFNEGNGKFVFDFRDADSFGSGVAIQPANLGCVMRPVARLFGLVRRILPWPYFEIVEVPTAVAVCGSVDTAKHGSRIGYVALTADGEPYQGWDVGRQVIAPPDGVEERAVGIVHHPLINRFVLLGSATQPGQPPGLVLYTVWVVGSAELARFSGVSPRGVAVDGTGRIVVAGRGPAGEIAAVRFHPDGRLDDSFGHAGAAMMSIPDVTTSVSAVATDATNRVLVTGTATTSEQ